MAKARKPKKTEPERDEVREHRITMEIIVDAYDEGERAMGWIMYLGQAELPLPDPLHQGAKDIPLAGWRRGGSRRHGPRGRLPARDVRGDALEHRRTFAIPLSQLKVVHGDGKTIQAVGDWHYWVERGYEF